MNAGKTVFPQILEHFPSYEFGKFVKKHNGIQEVRGSAPLSSTSHIRGLSEELAPFILFVLPCMLPALLKTKPKNRWRGRKAVMRFGTISLSLNCNL